MKPILLVALIFALGISPLPAPPAGTITEESQVPEYTLPDPLVSTSCKPITDTAAWAKQRRPEILRLCETEVYGRAPREHLKFTTEEISRDEKALSGKATRTEHRFSFPDTPGVEWYLLSYIPNNIPSPAPAFLGLNFNGNHTVDTDPGIRLSTA